jgi:hypothetical protein
MKLSYESDRYLSNDKPRMRAIIEFIEGDLSRPPVVFPCAGSDEVLRQEIQRLWSRD